MKKIRARKPLIGVKTARVERVVLVGLIERAYKDAFGDEHVPGSCLYWSATAIAVAAKLGIRLIMQAGTANFRRLPPHLDDGAPTTLTHFSYEWSGAAPPLDHPAVQLALKTGKRVLPEMHVWAADPARQEIVDLTTRFLPEMCERTAGLEWLEDAPPRFLWQGNPLPPGWSYTPNREATFLAMRHAAVEAQPALELVLDDLAF